MAGRNAEVPNPGVGLLFSNSKVPNPPLGLVLSNPKVPNPPLGLALSSSKVPKPPLGLILSGSKVPNPPLGLANHTIFSPKHTPMFGTSGRERAKHTPMFDTSGWESAKHRGMFTSNLQIFLGKREWEEGRDGGEDTHRLFSAQQDAHRTAAAFFHLLQDLAAGATGCDAWTDFAARYRDDGQRRNRNTRIARTGIGQCHALGT